MLEFGGIGIEVYRGLDETVGLVIMVVRRACVVHMRFKDALFLFVHTSVPSGCSHKSNLNPKP